MEKLDHNRLFMGAAAVLADTWIFGEVGRRAELLALAIATMARAEGIPLVEMYRKTQIADRNLKDILFETLMQDAKDIVDAKVGEDTDNPKYRLRLVPT